MASHSFEPKRYNSLSVIMPFRDEQATLHHALNRLLTVEFPVPVEVVLVDDGSQDDGVGTIRDLLLLDNVVLLRSEEGRGKGNAVRCGLNVASGDIVAVLDADLEYDPADLVPLVAAVQSGRTSVAYGRRPRSRKTFYSFWYMVGGRATSLWASLLFRSRVRDMHTSLKVAPREVWLSLGLRCDGFDLDTELTARLLRSGHRITELPVSYSARGKEEGKKLRWTAGVKSMWLLTRIRLEAMDGSVAQDAQPETNVAV
jgi:dolichol-phosphate hexosyltransferase